jgi:hypothetical protein
MKRRLFTTLIGTVLLCGVTGTRGQAELDTLHVHLLNSPRIEEDRNFLNQFESELEEVNVEAVLIEDMSARPLILVRFYSNNDTHYSSLAIRNMDASDLSPILDFDYN